MNLHLTAIAFLLFATTPLPTDCLPFGTHRTDPGGYAKGVSQGSLSFFRTVIEQLSRPLMRYSSTVRRHVGGWFGGEEEGKSEEKGRAKGEEEKGINRDGKVAKEQDPHPPVQKKATVSDGIGEATLIMTVPQLSVLACYGGYLCAGCSAGCCSDEPGPEEPSLAMEPVGLDPTTGTVGVDGSEVLNLLWEGRPEEGPVGPEGESEGLDGIELADGVMETAV